MSDNLMFGFMLKGIKVNFYSLLTLFGILLVEEEGKNKGSRIIF
jgi:hypothetical protein